jgi:hypothetical protein
MIVFVAALFAAGCVSEAPDYWETIPIMDGAGALEESPGALEYMVAAPLNEIEKFYHSRLVKDGWAYEGLGEGIGGLFLVFQRDEVHLEISAYRSADADQSRGVISLR